MVNRLDAASSARARCSSVMPFVLTGARLAMRGSDVTFLKLFPAVDGLVLDLAGSGEVIGDGFLYTLPPGMDVLLFCSDGDTVSFRGETSAIILGDSIGSCDWLALLFTGLIGLTGLRFPSRREAFFKSRSAASSLRAAALFFRCSGESSGDATFSEVFTVR